MKIVPRIGHLKELIRYSSKATLLIPFSVLDEKLDGYNKFKATRDALKHLKKDDDLIITEKDVENRFTEITIEVKGLDDIHTCSECKNADYYINWWEYPYFDPRCLITKNQIKPTDLACEHFKLIGRHSR